MKDEKQTPPLRVSPEEVEAAVKGLERELAGVSRGASQRLDFSPQDVEQGLAKLVLALVDMLRRLLERQAIRRMEAGSLRDDQIEQMGQALMKLEQKIRELAAAFGLKPEDLDLALGPLAAESGKLPSAAKK